MNPTLPLIGLSLATLSASGQALQLDAGDTESPSERILARTGVARLPEAPRYPYEEFYRTSPLSDFRFSEDGETVFFLKSDGNVRNVFSLDVPTLRTSQVTRFTNAVSAFRVDDSNRFLVAQVDEGGDENFALFKVDLESGQSIDVSRNPTGERSLLCDLSPDGRTLYYSQSTGAKNAQALKAVDLATFENRTLVEEEGTLLFCQGLSQDGRVLAFARFIENRETHLALFDLARKEVIPVGQEKAVTHDALTFDDKRGFFYLSDKDSDSKRLWRFDFDHRTSVLVPLPFGTNADIGDIVSVGLSRAGEVLSATFRDGLQTSFKDLRPGAVQEFSGVLSGSRASSAVFSKTDPTTAILIIAQGAAPDRYVLQKDSRFETFYDANASDIPPEAFAVPFSTRVNSFDGLPIPTHLFLPPGTNSSTKRPVVVWVHGGPEDHVDPGYSERLQFLANQGFVVVAPNVRGSSGFGKTYTSLDDGDWGGGHIRDLVAVARWAKALSFVDHERVSVVGGSFGGFSVLSLVTQFPTDFNAAVDVFGPAEMASFVDSWPDSVVPTWLRELGTDPREDEAFNRRVSPYYHLEDIAVPLQVHQGARDTRMPKEQSDRLVEALVRLGKPVEYHVYEDEGHGFRKFANARLAFTRIAAFLSAACPLALTPPKL
jgi:dipeptidyl aminopeptidase/acylaminoacyl peptidase